MIESWLEPVRRRLRGAIPYDSVVFRALSLTLTVVRLLEVEGVRGLVRVWQVTRSRESEFTLRLRSLDHPIVVRPAAGDTGAVVNNVVREEYGQFAGTIEPSVIIDAGAFIGDTAAYYLSRFPRARVIALEPVEEHYDLATRNMSAYGDRATVIRAALADQVGHSGLRGSGMTARLGGGTESVPTTTVPALMREHGLERLDILKLDIEGAESLVLGPACGDWLENTEWIVVELHGDESRRRVLHALEANGFEHYRHRNLLYGQNPSVRSI